MAVIYLFFVLLQMMQSGKALQLAADLGPSLESLADATFELLKMQDWFDSILVIDDSSASDILSFRVSFLYQRHRKEKRERTSALDDARSNPHAHAADSTRSRLQVIKISKNLSEKEVCNRNTVIVIYVSMRGPGPGDHKQIQYVLS